MTDIKTEGNASEASNQDQTTKVLCVIHNACDVTKSRWSIQDPIDAT